MCPASQGASLILRPVSPGWWPGILGPLPALTCPAFGEGPLSEHVYHMRAEDPSHHHHSQEENCSSVGMRREAQSALPSFVQRGVSEPGLKPRSPASTVRPSQPACPQPPPELCFVQSQCLGLKSRDHPTRLFLSHSWDAPRHHDLCFRPPTH